ncbi:MULTISPECIES: nucleoside-diphosphate sugar epimerase/dehydratase [unclassified Neisseria]|uniref:polysaccharide biosynthesis protein n=1 Tax=unclassified Neisseria TaxID=2623750 RepID=UPI00266659C2|nr:MULTISPECIES: nucleoside-diphosphate sugar epimerase/dehydratase [unclassified Neisseria]MDO1509627.1 nucleoside-diphosphate sugar epimerase/dehydratase [Neisseria sp. MVDL19-042950]MDO1515601.1 nucleoside-diphosphate sugar epimerase/dehydratase [Neisseria sp. MVDL18-041461]MDO1564026.1 nucleoside-diphosphate sugar epimerase/dehydratase [Neisseria sp. MVDL20-010259]
MNLETLLTLPRNVKKTFFVIHDAVVIFVAFWFAQSLKASYDEEWSNPANWLAFGSTAVLTVLLFIKLGLYRAVTRYVSTRVLTTAVFGCFISAVLFFLSVLIFEQRLRLALPIVYFLLLVVLVTSSRMILKTILSDRRGRKQMIPVIIYGAGQSGRQLLEAIKQVSEYYAVAFVDDNTAIQRTLIYDLMVYKPSELEDLISRYGVEKILLAIPSATQEERKIIVERLKAYPCEVLAIPGMKDLVDGKITVSALKKISVVDLLGRDPVAPDDKLMGSDITGKVVMVTGAGGSIGSELCRQIIRYRPAKLLLFELSEFSLYSIDKELCEFQTASNTHIEVIPLLGSIQHRKRLFSIMEAYGVQTVYHAAAYKHVPMVEFNTIEGVRNNVYGTLFCAQAAIDAGVETFVLISTDKAVRPTNTMGASKRMAELCLQALAAEPSQKTRFCMVRFGNVLGSSGSVVPVFEKQIAAGGPVTLTHEDITRYFMTIPEAAQLVIQAGAMGKGGDVFVLDMGESVKIIDLARQMIRLSGLEVKDEEHPDGNIEIKVTGLRPGEKLYEELLIGDDVQKTTHPRIMTASEVMLPWHELSAILERMDSACKEMNQIALRQLLLEAPTGFAPKDDICDLVWKQNLKAV